MVTAPLFIILVLAAFVAVKWGKAKIGHVLLGLVLGLSLASTSIGAPILHGITYAMSEIISTISHAAGGAQ